MARKYKKELVDTLQKNQETQQINGVEVRVKNIPDCDIAGAMDPRIYKEMRKFVLMSKIMPKDKMKMEMNMESVNKLREMFNSVDSIPIIDTEVSRKQYMISAEDGYEIPMSCFTREHQPEDSPILYFIHGGGFFAGSTDVVEDALKYLVETTGIIVFSIDYRLAPENPYPVGHEDCYVGLKWIYENARSFGGSDQNIFVAGDSAGGNLTLYCTNKSLDEGLDIVRGQLILYPTVNMGEVQDEYTKYDKNKFEIYKKHAAAINMGLEMFEGASAGLGAFLGTDDLLTKYLTPYLEVNPKLPPTFVTVGEHDYLKIETLAYAKKLVEAGVETEVIVYKGLGHAYLDRIGILPQAEDCVNEMGEFILAHQR